MTPPGQSYSPVGGNDQEALEDTARTMSAIAALFMAHNNRQSRRRGKLPRDLWEAVSTLDLPLGNAHGLAERYAPAGTAPSSEELTRRYIMDRSTEPQP